MDYKEQILQSCWQGMVRLVILHQAARGPVYGGRLSRLLRQQGYDISPGSLYPILHALEQAGLLTSFIKIFKGRARRYYKLTPTGRVCLGELLASLPPLIRDLLSELPPADKEQAGNEG